MKYPVPGFPTPSYIKLKPLTAQMIGVISSEIKAMLHASRDCLRNRYIIDKTTNQKDPRTFRFDVSDGYYGEAFGMMRTLQALGYGELRSVNLDGTHYNYEQPEQNLRWWFAQLEDEVLEEEHFGGSGVCTYCKAKYGKDDSDLSKEAQE